MVYLSHLPSWLCGVIIVSSFVVLSIIGLALFQWLIVGRLHLTEEMNNDIIFFASAIGVFYSLTVGLIAVGVWSTYSQVENTVSAEATAIGCFYRDVSGYPDPARTRAAGAGPRIYRFPNRTGRARATMWKIDRRRHPSAQCTRAGTGAI